MSIVFDEAYYQALMKENGYDPVAFGKINFGLGSLVQEDLQRRGLCHHNADEFARRFAAGEESIVTSGFGMSGVPHAGTISQILRSIALQKAGVPVQLVMGDLDAYNGKGTDLGYALELADKFQQFITNLGFKTDDGSILRGQINAGDVAITAQLIAKYMDEGMFAAAEEDLHSFYAEKGKVDDTPGMSFPRRMSLNLMVADFIDLYRNSGIPNVLVMLGIDEHQYVRFAQETVRRMQEDGQLDGYSLGGLYSSLIKGFFDFPKMSKSFPNSGITADLPAEEIQRRIKEGEGESTRPEDNVVYQLMASASTLSPQELAVNYDACLQGGPAWQKSKAAYTDMLVNICSKWPGGD